MNLTEIFTPRNVILGGGILALLTGAAGVFNSYTSTT